ncbi:MAG TPA: methionyl-tRNA formyltransferase [Candidatus Paceibacterota bacterium]
MTSATTIPFAFFGTPYIARDTLAALITAGYVPSVVVTSPDARRGRGMELTPCVTKELALAAGIPVLTPENLDDAFLAELQAYGCAYAVVVAYGKILPATALEAFPQGVLNVHYSLLPKYRGASPVETALLSGETETGVTVQRMVLKMDAGDILAQRAVPIDPDETIRELRPRLVAVGAELLLEVLPFFLEGAAVAVPQDESQATYARKIDKKDGCLSLKDDSKTNWQKYRAFAESPGTYFYAEKGDQRIRVRIEKASYIESIFTIERIVPESKASQDFAMLVRNGWCAA